MIARKPSLSTIYTVGDRVQLHPASSRWMQGDRFGTIEAVGKRLVHVRMDRSAQLAKLHPSNIGEVIQA